MSVSGNSLQNGEIKLILNNFYELIFYILRKLQSAYLDYLFHHKILYMHEMRDITNA